ncbi:methyltransferase-like protein 13 [Quillaja saponaria]|uniref:Methyltransferase-like protein 13 n=1 Tax=Quillaja saponaria TaxID=32244 RepID=A0AAD7PYR5_QUISA|nr:methyltransferase-like protein 13 [Quillaja saponaria]KAJ7971671.1 methyltransferase-like protein 13 [Quillaja saponaria]
MGKNQSDELLQTLGDFTSKENWDKFFKIRGCDNTFEWYAEWAELREPLLYRLTNLPNEVPSQATSLPGPSPQILIPGCGNSRLSEHLYDAGFRGITNIDFSKVVISDMLRRNVRQRPDMRWRIMDMTSMQFTDETFDIILDKGGLDALMEPELGSKLGTQYLAEVKRVLKPGGRYICLTLAESHVLGLLFPTFRFGWRMSVHAIALKPSSKPNLQTFMVVLEKEISTLLHQITSSFHNSSLDSKSEQVCGLYEALENENKIRRESSSGSNISYPLEALQLGATDELAKLSRGRRLQLTLGGQGGSRFCYEAVLLDAQQQGGPFTYYCGVFLVPKSRAREWLFFSEEGQWMVVKSSKAARLIMVFLDTGHANASMDDIQKDLSLLVKPLAPGKDDNGSQIPFMMASDGIKQRTIVHQVTSSLTGPITVEDVVYEDVGNEVKCILPSREIAFRRLIFERAANLVQSEAVLKEGSPIKLVGEFEKKKTTSSSKSKKRGARRRNDEPSIQLAVYHGYLASSYHTGIISGFILISSYLESVASCGKMVKAAIIGLGAGLLPMFLRRCMPFMLIEVVELDPLILDLARDYFNFTEDECLKVHIADGIKFFGETETSTEADSGYGNGNCLASQAEDTGDLKFDIIIIDVDSSDSSSGMTCPAPEFLEESFLETIKVKLSKQGLFVVNLVSRSPAIKEIVLLRMKKVFGHLFCLQLDEDVNEVHFALNSESCISEGCFPDATVKLEKLLKFQHPEIGQSIIDATKKIKRLK